jgi:c(7)-type cytochrome triheme protein
MKRVLGLLLVAALGVAYAADSEKAKTDEKKAPDTIVFDKTAKMPAVTFPHALHAKKLGGCKDCHEGEKPLFAQKKSEAGFKMADIYKGMACGACHDGKKMVDGKAVFAAKTSCMKCHNTKKVEEKKAEDKK